MNSLWNLFIAFAAANLSLLIFSVVTSGLYDIRQAKSKRLRRQERSGSHKDPFVTIVIPAHNEASVIERCLESVSRLLYQNTEIIVLNDGSTDETSAIARAFSHANKTHIKVVDIYPNMGKGGALNKALEEEVSGELLMVVDADCTLDQNALSRIVKQFEDHRVMCVCANVRINKEPSLMALVQRIEYIIGYYHKKHTSYTNSEFIVGGQGATYRTEILRKIGGFRADMQTEDIAVSISIAALGNKYHQLAYDDDALIYTEAVPTLSALYKQRLRWKLGALQAIWLQRRILWSNEHGHTKLLTWFRLPWAVIGELRLLIEPAFLALFIAIAVAQQNVWIFAGSWFSLVLYSSCVILADEHSHTKDKLQLIVANAILYPLNLMMTLINVIAFGECITRIKEITGAKKGSGSWTPPTRIGRKKLA